MHPPPFDAIIVGGGPAGLSAATLLGRCHRRVLLCDAGRPRNSASKAMHGFLSRDGIEPARFRAAARQDLARYPSVSSIGGIAHRATRDADGFSVAIDGYDVARGRKLLIATGVVDELPPLPGIEQFYGESVHHCPYCDGFEHTRHAIAVYGRGEKGAGLALMLRLWSTDVVLCSDGPAELPADRIATLSRHGIGVREERIAQLEGSGSELEAVRFADGSQLERDALFFNTGQHQRSPLLDQLGCAMTGKGGAATHDLEETNIPGLYVAGDASRDVQLVVVAAAEGARAAFAINRALLAEDGLG